MRSVNLLIPILLLFASDTLLAQPKVSIKASVSKNVLSARDRLTYKVEVFGEEFTTFPNVELPPLTDFFIIAGPTRSSNFQYINGKISSTKSYSWVLAPKKPGNITIGAAMLKHKGKVYRTKPISVRVTASPVKSPPITRRSRTPSENDDTTYLEAVSDKKEVYRGEQITVTYKIFTQVDIVNYNTPTPPAAVGFWVEEIKLPDQPVVEEEIIDGVRYSTAVISKIALFPTKKGELKLEPLALDYKEKIKRSRRGFFDFDDFFDDPLFSRYKARRVHSNELNFNVLPLPDEGRPEDFSGAVGKYDISVELDSRDVKVDDALTLKIKLSGTGNLKSVSLPEIEFPEGLDVFDPDISQKSSQRREIISGVKTYEFVLIPRKEGLLTIDPISFDYFNPARRRYEIASTKEVQLMIQPAERSIVESAPGLSKEEVALLGSDIRYIKLGEPSFRKAGSTLYRSGWLIVWGVSPLLALAGAFFFRNHLDKMSTNVAYQRRRRASTYSRRKLKHAREAMLNKDFRGFYTELNNAILGAAADKLNLPAASITAQEISDAMKEKNVSNETIRRFMDLSKSCEFAIFSPEAGGADVQKHYDSAQHLLDEILKVL